MAKRIIPKEYIGQVHTNKNEEVFKIIKYLFKNKSNYCFDIEFAETKAIQMATLTQIRNGTCIDLEQRKKMKRIQTELKLRERNKLVKKAKNTTIIPSNLDEKKVLAIDLATKSTGIAYSNNGKIVRWKTIVAPAELEFRDRAAIIIKEIIDILDKGKIDTVIMEDIYLGLNSSILTMLSEIRGMLTYYLTQNKINLLLIPAVLWKNKYYDMPHGRKEQKEFVKQKFFELTGEEADSDDMADAYFILKACLM